MQFIKGALAGIAAIYIISFIYKAFTYPKITTTEIIALSIYQILPDIFLSIFLCVLCMFSIWFYRWRENVSIKKINIADDKAAEIIHNAEDNAYCIRTETEDYCYKLRMQIDELHAAAKEKHNCLIHLELYLVEQHQHLREKLEADFTASKQAYIAEIEGLVKKNKKLQASYSIMIKNYNGALTDHGLDNVASKYSKRSTKILASTYYLTPGIENILLGKNPVDTP